MDYRHVAIDTLSEFAEEQPSMTLGEMIYSTLRENNFGRDIGSIKNIKELGDKEIYLAVDKAKRYERE